MTIEQANQYFAALPEGFAPAEELRAALPAAAQQVAYVGVAGTAGKTAAAAANLLRGKLKPEYTPHTDCGDFVIIINAEKAVLTGKKLEQKYYRTHSGWIGGLKEVQYSTLMRERPELAMKLAVRGMMPRNVISKDSMSRLKIYRGGEHEHAAQKPELWAL